MFKFYESLSFEESLDHKHTDWSPDNIYSYRQWYEEDIQGRDTLLVMIGDSWTWGDHLGSIDWDKSSNDPCRMEQIAGRKLSNLLNSDWVNLAKPGCSNYWMLEQLQNIEPHLHRVQNQYKKIRVVISLTEDLRESKYSRRINVDRPYKIFWDTSISLEDFLVKVEQYLFLNIETYFKNVPFVDVKISRVFTDVWPGNTSPLLLDKSWCDVIQDKIKFDNYQKPVPFIGQMSIDPLTEKFISTKTERKLEFLDIMERVATRWNFLGASEYNLKGSTCHPNPAGHQLWAEYLYSKMA
jgi:hypothetical protein